MIPEQFSADEWNKVIRFSCRSLWPFGKKDARGDGESRGRFVLGPVTRGGALHETDPKLIHTVWARPNLAHPLTEAYDAQRFLNGGWPARSCRVQAFRSKRRLMRYFAPLVGLVLFSAAAVSEPATAQPNRAREGVQSGEVRSLNDIVNGIRRERPGSLADVEGPNFGPYGEPHYRLKWLTPDGRVLMLDTDARTGRVLGVQGDDRGPARGGPGPGAAPNRGDPRDPRAAQGQRRNLNPPPGSDYDFGAPGIRPPRGGIPNRRNVPEQNFAPGPPPGYYGPPPDFRRGPPPDVRRGPPPGYESGPRRGPPRPQSFEPPREQRTAPPPQQRFDRGGLDRGAPTSPRAGFRNGGSFGGGATERQGRIPSGEPRGRRSFR